jgi:hypothetical protein
MSAVNIVDLQQNVENLKKELKRSQIEKVVPMDSIRFRNESTGDFDGSKYAAEVEKRMNGSLSIEEVSELWQDRLEVERFNIMQQQQRSNNPRARTGSMFDYTPQGRTNVNVHHTYEPPGGSMSYNYPVGRTASMGYNNPRNKLWFLELFDNMNRSMSGRH